MGRCSIRTPQGCNTTVFFAIIGNFPTTCGKPNCGFSLLNRWRFLRFLHGKVKAAVLPFSKMIFHIFRHAIKSRIIVKVRFAKLPIQSLRDKTRLMRREKFALWKILQYKRFRRFRDLVSAKCQNLMCKPVTWSRKMQSDRLCVPLLHSAEKAEF